MASASRWMARAMFTPQVTLTEPTSISIRILAATTSFPVRQQTPMFRSSTRRVSTSLPSSSAPAAPRLAKASRWTARAMFTPQVTLRESTQISIRTLTAAICFPARTLDPISTPMFPNWDHQASSTSESLSVPAATLLAKATPSTARAMFTPQVPLSYPVSILIRPSATTHRFPARTAEATRTLMFQS